MSAYEYLNTNSLTAYPFRDGAATNTILPLDSDIFLDILFVIYDEKIKKPYLKKLNVEIGGITLWFHDVDGDALILRVEIPQSELVDHYKNNEKSFFGYKENIYYPKAAIKLVFGPGANKLINGPSTVVYTPEQTEISPAAVQYSVPEVSSLEFESWFPDFDSAYFNPNEPQYVFPVKKFPREDEVKMRYGFNNVFNYLAPRTMYLDVSRGAGLGLYDGCPDYSDVVVQINKVDPDPSGNMYLKVSDCHGINLLTDGQIEKIVNESLWDNRPDRTNYVAFPIAYPKTGDPNPFNVVDTKYANHGFTLANFCSPKCPSENLNAFAEYLNRVKDGVAELYKVVENPIETCGRGIINGNVLTAVSFCQDANLPSGWQEATNCGSGFIKYFHEGRKVKIQLNNSTSYNLDIVEVIESVEGVNTQVILSQSVPELTNGTEYVFKVLEFGLLNKLNFEIAKHNQSITTTNAPYTEFNYSTVEAFNTQDLYVTFITTVTVIYNPGDEPLNFSVDLTTLTGTSLIGTSIKIKDSEGLIKYGEYESSIPCKKYATFEAICYVPCGKRIGQLTIQVTNKDTGEELINSPKVITVLSADCVDISVATLRNSAYEDIPFGINLKENNQNLQISEINYIIEENLATQGWINTSNDPDGVIPPWGGTEKYHIYGLPSAILPGVENKSYTISIRYTTPDGTYSSKLYLDYFAKPRILNYTNGDIIRIYPPDTVNRTYTEGSPLIQIAASNKPTSYKFEFEQGNILPGFGWTAGSSKLLGKYSYSPNTQFPKDYQVTLKAKNSRVDDSTAIPVSVTVRVYDTAEILQQTAYENVPYFGALNIPTGVESISLVSTIPSWLAFKTDLTLVPVGYNFWGVNTSQTSILEKIIVRYNYADKFENREIGLNYVAKPRISYPPVGENNVDFTLTLRPPDFDVAGNSKEYTETAPLLKITSTNQPNYVLSNLPEGLNVLQVTEGINKAALIVGKINSSVIPGDYTVEIQASNSTEISSTAQRNFILRLLDSAISLNAYEDSTFCYKFIETLKASQFTLPFSTDTPKPSWLAINYNIKDNCQLLGKPTTSLHDDASVNKQYRFTLNYTPLTAPDARFRVEYALNYVAKPRLLSPTPTDVISVTNLDLVEYTEANPLLRLDVQNTPTTINNTPAYVAKNLPIGLSITQTGKIVGIISPNTITGDYTVSLELTNSAGTTKTSFKISISNFRIETAKQLQPYCYKIKGMIDVTSYSYTPPNSLPTWLNFDSSVSSACNFFGTPPLEADTNQVYNLTLYGNRPSGSITQSYQLIYIAKPVIQYPANLTTFTVSLPDFNSFLFSSSSPLFKVEATNNPTSYRLVGFNPGTFRVDNLGNVIGTTGSEVYQTPKTITIYATNSAGDSNPVTVYFKIVNTVKSISFNSTATGTCSTGNIYKFNTAEDNANSIEILDTLPSWLIFNSDKTSNCNLTLAENRPAFNSAQKVPFTLTRNYAGGKTREAYELTVIAPPVITNPVNSLNSNNRTRYVISQPDFNNRVYTEQFPLLTVSATNNPISISATGLPNSLTIISSGIHIGKIVSFNNAKVNEIGLYTVTVSANNGAGFSQDVVFEIQIKNEVLQIYTNEGQPLDSSLCKIVTRDNATFYSLSSGNLPNGIQFTGSAESTCNFSGIPAGINAQVNRVDIKSNYVGGFSTFAIDFYYLSKPTIVKFLGEQGEDIVNNNLTVSPSYYVGRTFSSASPLFMVVTTGQPSSFYAEGFPLLSTLTIDCEGNAVGEIQEAAQGIYTVKIIAINQSGESSSKTIILNLSKNVPTIEWDTPEEITYGTPLTEGAPTSSAQLRAVAKYNGVSLAGTIIYNPTAGTILSAGTARILTATFVPQDSLTYTSIIKSVNIKVNRAIPSLIWNNPAPILYYTQLSTAQLNATSTIIGDFLYSPGVGTRLNARLLPYDLTVTFNPADTTNYTSRTATVQLTVNPRPVTADNIYWAAPNDITYNTPLSATQLNALARLYVNDSSSPTVPSSASSYVYNPPAGTILSAGTHTLSVSFVSSDTVNFVSTPAVKTITLNVLKLNAFLSWATPVAITYGTPLSSTQLNASSSVQNLTYTYFPATGTILDAGTQTLTVTASGNPNYNEISTTRQLFVNRASSTLTFTSPSSGRVDDVIDLYTQKTGSSGTTVYSCTSTNTIQILNLTQAKLIASGTATIKADVPTDANYNGITASQIMNISRGISTLILSTSSINNSVRVGESILLYATKTGSTSAVVLSSLNLDKLTISGNTATALAAGTATVSATLSSDLNYESATAQQVITITKGISSITITSANSGVESNTLTLTTTKTGSTGAITYTSSNTQVVNIVGGVAVLGVPGQATITAVLAADNNYQAAQTTQLFTVSTKGLSTITYTGNLSGLIDEVIALKVTKTGSTGNIVYTSQNTSIGIISGTSSLTLLAAGTVNITATLLGDNNFTEVSTTFQITSAKKPSSISIVSPISLAVGKLITINVNKTGSTGAVTYGINNTLATISTSGEITPLATGSITVTAYLAGDAKYLPSSGNITTTIAKGETLLNITAPLTGKVGTTSQVVFTKTGSTASPQFSTNNNNLSITTTGSITFLKAGSGLISGAVASDTNYLAGADTQSIIIDKGESAITIEYYTPLGAWSSSLPTNIDQGTKLQIRPVVTGSSPGKISFSTNNSANVELITSPLNSVTGVTLNIVNVSVLTQNIQFTLAQTSDYEGSSVSHNLTINPLPVITSGLSVSGVRGRAFSYTVIATNATSYKFYNVPSWLTVTSIGVPNNTLSSSSLGIDVPTGNTNITMTATNAVGTVQATLVLSITSLTVV